MLPREELLRAQRRFCDVLPISPEAVCRGRSVSCEVDAGYSRSIRCPEYGTHIVSTADIMQKHCDLHTIYNIQNTIYCPYAFPLPPATVPCSIFDDNPPCQRGRLNPLGRMDTHEQTRRALAN